MAYVLLYVDGIVLTASSPTLLQHVIGALEYEFFDEKSVRVTPLSLVHIQWQYAHDMLERAGMMDCNHVPCQSTPTQSLLLLLVRSSLMALSFAALSVPPNISHLHTQTFHTCFQQVCLHMHDPQESNLKSMKGILHYVCGTLDLGHLIRPSTTSALVVYSDADWTGCPDTHKCTSGYVVFLSNNVVSWSSKRHNIVSRSNAETEYRSVANAIAEASCLPIRSFRNFTLVCPRLPQFLATI